MHEAPSIDPAPFPVSSLAGTPFPPGTSLRLPAVWLRGAVAQHPEWLRGKVVSLVGARAASRGALEFTRAVAAELARRGWLVLSGGALGVDGAAHEGALSVGGRTVAVLGTGLDVAYPERHAGLFERMLPTGGLMSPFPLGTRAKPGRFPTRNPIIAALAEAVVIVEAGARSGSLGTAEAARRLGRRLFARPGSPGCDGLLARRHASAAPDAASLVAHITGDALPEADAGSALAGRLCAALHEPAGAEALAQALDLPISHVLEGLCELELSRRTIRLQDGRYLALSGAADLKE